MFKNQIFHQIYSFRMVTFTVQVIDRSSSVFSLGRVEFKYLSKPNFHSVLPPSAMAVQEINRRKLGVNLQSNKPNRFNFIF